MGNCSLSAIQAACIPRILSGADTIVAAETGSGKTHGYLVPLIDMLSRISDNSEEALSNDELQKIHTRSLVLCPNVMLCEQVAHMAKCLCNENGEQLLSVATVCGHQVQNTTYFSPEQIYQWNSHFHTLNAM